MACNRMKVFVFHVQCATDIALVLFAKSVCANGPYKGGGGNRVGSVNGSGGESYDVRVK